MIGCFGLFDGVAESLCCSSCDDVRSKLEIQPTRPSPVHLRDAVRTAVGALRIFGGNNGLQVLSLPPLLSSATIGSIIRRSRDLFGFVYSGLFYVISIHDPTRMSM